MSRRTAGLVRRLAPAGLAVLGLAAEGVAVALARPGSARWNELAVALSVAAYATVGVLILWHRPRHRIGWLAVVIAAIWGVGEALVAASYRTLSVTADDPGAALMSVTGTFLRGLPWLLAVLWLPLVFPDGVLLRTRLGRVAAGFSALTLTAFTVGSLLSPELGDLRLTRSANPLGFSGSLGRAVEALAAVSLLLGAVTIALAVAVLVQRYRRTGALGRQQTALFGCAFLAPLVSLVLSASDSADPWVFGVTSALVPLALGLAILQRRLYDLPLLANRALTYTALWTLIAVLYGVAVGGVGAFLGQEGAAWLPWAAAGLVAVTFAPLREAMQQAANKVTYGQWARPEEVLSRTSRRLADVADVRALLEELVADLAEDLGLGAVEVLDARGAVLASAGRVGVADELHLTAYGAPVGRLRWSRRDLRDGDRRLLEDLAGQLGAVVHAESLLRSLQNAQERLVATREEERRRLRRDLHDGVGPALAGLGLRVDTVRNVLRRGDTGKAEGSLLDLRAGIQDTVTEVRRIVEDLRPATLDDLGLVEALEAALPDAPPVRLVADRLPTLPAAVELAAFRIAQEALTNVVRHAAATRAEVCLEVQDAALVLRVADDGNGGAAPRAGGVGLTSMRERAEEVGGRLVLQSDEGAGTTVLACLPLEVST